MIGRLAALAMNTYREAVRQKVLYTLAFFTAVLILFSFFLGQLSLGADTKIIKDLGLGSMMVFGSMIAIFVGIGLVHKEVERRTIYTILAKPVSRAEFIVGKYLGLAFTLAVEIGFMTLLIFGILSLYREPLDYGLLKAVLMIYFEICVLISVALVFSSYSSSFMSALFSISFLVVGHVVDDFAQIFGRRAVQMTQETGFEAFGGFLLKGVIEGLGMISLDHFSINALVVHGAPVPWAWIGQGFLFAASWITLFLLLAIRLFKKKDLT